MFFCIRICLERMSYRNTGIQTRLILICNHSYASCSGVSVSLQGILYSPGLFLAEGILRLENESFKYSVSYEYIRGGHKMHLSIKKAKKDFGLIFLNLGLKTSIIFLIYFRVLPERILCFKYFQISSHQLPCRSKPCVSKTQAEMASPTVSALPSL